MSQEREAAQEEEQMNTDSSDYQQGLAQRSCSEYEYKTRSGTVNSNEHPKKVDYMFSKKIKMILLDCDLAIFLVTENGEVYHWWDVSWSDPILKYYYQLIDLRNTRIVQTATGGNSTFIALTEDERLYYFETKYKRNGRYEWMKRMKFEKKVICVSCGRNFFVVITDDHKVYTWGLNDKGQLGNSTCTDKFIEELHEVKFIDSKIVKVACGFTHTLALSDKGNIFGWGGNIYGQLNLGHREDNPSPAMITIINNKQLPNVNKKLMTILDIAAMKSMSSAIAEDGYIYVWGVCFDQQIRKPIACEFTTMFDMSNALSARPPTSVKHLKADERSNILKNFADAFDNPRDSDLMIKVGALSTIYVHKFMLKIRSKIYFNNIVQFITTENDQDVVRLNQFSYTMYYAFLKYLYTGKIDLSLEEKFDLLTLADEVKEPKFERSCYNAIKEEITVVNVFSIYRMAKTYNRMIVMEYCFEFFKENKDDIIDMDSFFGLDQETKNIFMSRI